MSTKSAEPIRSNDRWIVNADGATVGVKPARSERAEAQWARLDSASRLLDTEGAVLALSEAVEEVLADPSATTQILTGPGEYCHYRCTTATGNITVYDNTASSGKVLVPTTALVLGTHPIFGAGDPRSLQVSLGIRVVLSGAGVAYIGRRVG